MRARSSNIKKRFLEFCTVNKLFQDGTTVLVAVSGGADSVVLLHLLGQTCRALSIKIAVGHLDHMIRPDSAADLEFVRDLSARLKFPFYSRRSDVPAEAAATGRSMEDAARNVRYRLLAEMADEASASATATGHSMTDQTETLLMRVIRGTGPSGLAGISRSKHDGVVRPLLCLTRDEIRDYAKTEGLEYREDPTNTDEHHLRNRIRARLLPLLLEFNPRIEPMLSELAQDVASLNKMIDGLVDDRIVPAADSGWLIPRKPPVLPGLEPYLIREAFNRITGEPLGLSRNHIEVLIPMLGQFDKAAQVHLPRRVVVISNMEGLLFTKDLDEPPPGIRRKPVKLQASHTENRD